jgi:biotin synthase
MKPSSLTWKASSGDIKHIGGGALGLTLCSGEQTEETYRRWFEAGAHRYLLRIETSNPRLYATLHPQDGHHEWQVRKNCLDALGRIGWQVGTGVMIGLPGTDPGRSGRRHPVL